MILKRLPVVFAVAFLSCTERIEITPDPGYIRLVVDGAVTNEAKSHVVRLTTTSDYFSGKPAPPVSGAQVTISDGQVSYSLRETSPGVYRTSSVFAGIPGHRYDLYVKLSSSIGGHTEYSAGSVMAFPVTPDSLEMVYHPGDSDDGTWETRVYFQDPPTVDFYRFMIYRNTELLTDTLTEWYVTDDRFFSGKYVKGWTVCYLHFRAEDKVLAVGDKLVVEMNMIGKEYAGFISGAQSEVRGSYPLFTGPPANVAGNVDNGAFGFFAAYSLARISLVYPWHK